MTIENIDVATLKLWMDKGEVALVDVRELAEWNAGHIAGATLVPLSGFTVQAMPPAQGKKLVIYCRSGKRSLTACDILQRHDASQEVYNLEGGILAWNAKLGN